LGPLSPGERRVLEVLVEQVNRPVTVRLPVPVKVPPVRFSRALIVDAGDRNNRPERYQRSVYNGAGPNATGYRWTRVCSGPHQSGSVTV
jgi:hypothetical protein